MSVIYSLFGIFAVPSRRDKGAILTNGTGNVSARKSAFLVV